MRDAVPLEVSAWFWRLAGASLVVGVALFCGRYVEEQAQARRIALHSAQGPKAITTLSALTAQAPEAPVAALTSASCLPQVTVAARSGAMLSVVVEAPCAAGNRVSFEHAGLQIAETMPIGRGLHLMIPALDARGEVSVTLSNGATSVAWATVPDLDAYRRFAIAWEGDAMVRLTGPEGQGFVTELGDAALEGQQRAQIISVPAETAGHVTVDLAATAASCGQKINGRTILSTSGYAEATGLSVDLPECGTAPAVLHLKNLDRETTLAQG